MVRPGPDDGLTSAARTTTARTPPETESPRPEGVRPGLSVICQKVG